ncbi:MAG: hypothetical protein HYZ28_06555 [Myxococcales bacterium]|nr:hypothetical protein [Myxococcales bacterium]
MKLRIIGIVAGLIGVAAYVGACNVPQPSPGCPVGHGPYAVKFTKVTGTGPCSQIPGDLVGLEKYVVPGAADGKVAIRVNTLGSLWADVGRVDPADPDGKKINALGKIGLEPGGDNFCPITGVSAAEQAFEEIPATPNPDGGADLDPGAPALSIKYQWKNFKVYATALAPGTQFASDLTYTEDTCTAEYKAWGVWPPVACAGEDADGNPVPDESLCHPNPDAGQRSACDPNSGFCLNSDFDVTCDKDLMLCVLKQEPPSLLKK